jgi:hypothetical protein
VRAQLANQVSRTRLWVIAKNDITNFLMGGVIDGEASTTELRQLGLQLRADAVVRIHTDSMPGGVRLEAALLRWCDGDEPRVVASVTEPTLSRAALVLARRLAADSALYLHAEPVGATRQCRLTTR